MVEDEPELALTMVDVLRERGYAVDSATSGSTAEDKVAGTDYDLVILDWGIPAPSGRKLLQRWRKSGYSMPVLMVTGRSAVADRVDCLECGADDYLVKPFAFAELLARVHALLRRRDRPVAERIVAGGLELDRRTCDVTLEGRPVRLSPKEYGLLEYLLMRRDQVVGRAELGDHVWDEQFDPHSNVIDVLIHRLRKKIDHDDPRGRLLHTVPGVGYLIRSRRE